ncbi:DHS-like NAD/FAD-binding domain-containing protein [Durotheca rogersii]|uniref:DHS-like NAD/FAD-binding domain-containing protein n=1 Tax=Durotheca rogersii TaxID=419775 RepID=UPI0022209610|nr:DHS-like NAD/FAD-binding domain-containing protein [Durotheca rogersii]KAI5865171.1 DHS-like NAD/FAD-binding domain-containing protein [Durotheca rogersii]
MKPSSSDPISVENEIHVNPDGPPPAKRRRVERKPRTTEYLDLKAASEEEEKDEKLLVRLTSILRKKKKIIIIAGAGISVSAGIPDFRSSKGLFATLPKEHGLKGTGKQLFDASVYKHDSMTSYFHNMVRDLWRLTQTAKPTPFHHLIASLAKEGRLLRLYTQNVDGLDTSMPPLATAVPLNTKGPWPKAIQLHGGLAKMVCSKCGEIKDFESSLFEGPEAPLCKGCEETDNVRTSHAGKRSHGIGRLRPRMVLYNEYNPDQESIANVVRADIRARPDAVIVVGTTLKIPGVRNMVKDMCRVTRDRKDGVTAWINLDPEPTGADLKNCWDLVVRGKCDDIATLVHLPRYDEDVDAAVVVDNKKYEDSVRGVKLEIEIRKTPTANSALPIKSESRDATPVEAKPQLVQNAHGMPTPTASPKVRAALPAVKPLKKQRKLAFPSLDGSTSANSAAPAKDTEKAPKQRKPRQTKKAAEPKPTKAAINKAFKATKASSAAATASKIPAKRNHEPDLHSSALSPRSVMREEFSLRPRGKALAIFTADPAGKRNALGAVQNLPAVAQSTERPTTPTRTAPPCPASSSPPGTISPTSKPRGFATLID